LKKCVEIVIIRLKKCVEIVVIRLKKCVKIVVIRLKKCVKIEVIRLKKCVDIVVIRLKKCVEIVIIRLKKCITQHRLAASQSRSLLRITTTEADGTVLTSTADCPRMELAVLAIVASVPVVRLSQVL